MTFDLADANRKMVTIRLLEDRLQKLCDVGLAGDLHFNKGQEAIAVGVCAALLPSDRVVTHHRTIAHQIAKGAPLRPLVAELLGKRTGVNGGRAGEMHISDPSIGYDFSFQLVGTCIPVGVGLAWALRQYRRTNDVVAVFFGDAAASNGQFHEGMNLASIRQAPVLLICENNRRAGNIDPEHYARTSIEAKARGYGIKHARVDGNDVEVVAHVVDDVLGTVRRGQPFLVECMTERLCWHKQGQRDVRSKDELDFAARTDPLLKISYGPDGTDASWVDADAIGRELDELIESVMTDLPPEY